MPPQRGDDDSTRLARQREKDARRSRGEISCAECRRLKLRCDKKVPCSTCSRRGCQTICPTGTLTTGTGSRTAVPSTPKLKSILLELSARIRQLEDALAISHAAQSGNPHPLLSKELLQIKFRIDALEDDLFGQEKERREGKERETGVEADRNVDLDHATLEAFGTLSLGESGAERFLGLSNGSQSLTNPPPDPPSPDTQFIAALPPHLAYLAKAWPFPPVSSSMSEVRALIEAQLPSWERANALCEAFLAHLGWSFRPIEREQLIVELLPAVYRRVRAQSGASTLVGLPTSWSSNLGSVAMEEREHQEYVPVSWRGHLAYTESTSNLPPSASTTSNHEPGIDAYVSNPPFLTDMHELALLLLTFAVSVVADPTTAPYKPEAELYAQLARAALAVQPISDGATLATVQALTLMGVYTALSARRANYEPAWVLFSLANSVAASIGLHRDPARWKLDSKTVNRRRSIFWELLTVNSWQSLSCGRPAVFCLHNNDVKFPEDDDATVDEKGKITPGYWRWKHKFTKEVLAPVTERMTVASSMKYSFVLELDRVLRDFNLEHFGKPWMDVTNVAEETKILQHASSMIAMDVVSMYIHRNFFAKAVLDHPDDPLLSPYAPSFLAAFRSSTTILKLVRDYVQRHGALLLRLWPVWGHALSAAVIIATVVTRGPSSTLAPAAFIELGLAVSLFEKVTAHPVVREGLPILVRLRDIAQQALYERRTKAVSDKAQARHAEEQQNKTTVPRERWWETPQPASAFVTSSPSVVGDSPASTSHPTLSPIRPGVQQRQSPQAYLEQLVKAPIPRAVRDTRAATATPSRAHGLGENAHPEILSWAGRYFRFQGTDTPTVYPTIHPYSAPVSTSSTPPIAGPSWHSQRLHAPVASPPDAADSRAKGITSFFNFSEKSAFVQSAPPAAQELGFESSVFCQPGQPTPAPEPGPGLEPNELDYTSLLQMPMDADMDDAWKVFVQNSGFVDPGIFDL